MWALIVKTVHNTFIDDAPIANPAIRFQSVTPLATALDSLRSEMATVLQLREQTMGNA